MAESGGPIKGVMLPQRPPDGAGGGQLGGVFRPPGGTNEPWGMCPVHKVSMAEVAVKPPGINAAHKRWVRQLESELAARKLDDHLKVVQEADKHKNVGEFSAKLRAAVLSQEDKSFWKATRMPAMKTMSPTKTGSPAKDSPAASTSASATDMKTDSKTEDQTKGKEASSAPKQHTALDDLDEFVDSVYHEAAAKQAETTGRTSKAGTEQPSSVPVAHSNEGAHPPAARRAGQGEEKAATSSGALAQGEGTSGREAGKEGERKEGKGGSAPPPPGASTTERPGSSQSMQSQSKAGKGKGKPANKPAWALSQSEAEKKEMSEEDELLAFTEQLDFDAFMDQLDDVELKGAFQELQDIDKNGGDEKAWQKSFVRACNHAAMRRCQNSKKPANSDDEADNDCAQSVGTKSVASTRLRAKSALLDALSKKHDQWDSSTRAGDDVAKMGEATKTSAAAEEFLLENPEMRSVHSTASVRAQLEKMENAEQGS